MQCEVAMVSQMIMKFWLRDSHLFSCHNELHSDARSRHIRVSG